MRCNHLLVALACAAAACGGGGGSELKPNLGLDLANVDGFVIAGTPTPGGARRLGADQGSGSGSTLYALGKDGTLTVTTVTDGTSASSEVQPAAVFDSPAYLFFMYWGVTYQGANCPLIPVRKADGAMYCVTDVPNPGPIAQELDSYWPVVAADATGAVVWIDHGSTLARLDLGAADPTESHPLDTSKLPPGHLLMQAVNAHGDDLVSWTLGPDGDRFTRVLLRGGGYLNVSDRAFNCIYAGLAANPDDFYGVDNDRATGVYTFVHLARAADGSYTRHDVLTLPSVDCSAGLVKAGTHVIVSGLLPGTTATALVEITDEQTTMIDVGGPLTRIAQVAGVGDTLFVLGNDPTGASGIVTYDLPSQSLTTLLAPGAYNIATMTVSPGGDVTFAGQRAADGAYVLGNIPAGTTTVDVIATDVPGIIQIARIN